jgi:hypothetical protein
VHAALRPWSVTAGPTAASSFTARKNRFLIGGVAVLGASVIAVTPVAHDSVALEVQQRAVHLAAAVTDSPADVYGSLVTNTVNNIGTLAQQYSAKPFPILTTIINNQAGYLQRVVDSFGAANTAFQTWWENGTRESAPGKTLLANIGTALAAGDFGAAYENFNRITLFAFQNTILPILNGTLFTTTTTPGIPQQMAQNVTNAIGAFFSAGTLVYGAFQSVYAPISGAAFEFARALGAVGNALSTGNVQGAITALVNTPGVVANAFLNGFDYNAGDTTEAWSGIFSPKGTRASGGPISQFFITIAQKIAAAFATPVATAPVTTTTTAALTAAAAATSSTETVAAEQDPETAATTVTAVTTKRAAAAQVRTAETAESAAPAVEAAEPVAAPVAETTADSSTDASESASGGSGTSAGSSSSNSSGSSNTESTSATNSTANDAAAKNSSSTKRSTSTTAGTRTASRGAATTAGSAATGKGRASSAGAGKSVASAGSASGSSSSAGSSSGSDS